MKGVGVVVEEGGRVEPGLGADIELAGVAAAGQLEGQVLEVGVGVV